MIWKPNLAVKRKKKRRKRKLRFLEEPGSPVKVLKSSNKECNFTLNLEVQKRNVMERRKYNIVLEKGEALRPYYELSESERQEIAKRVFEKVKRKAAEVGTVPVTKQTLKTLRAKGI